MAAAVAMQSPSSAVDPKIQNEVGKLENRLTSLVNKQYQLYSQIQYLSSSSTWETIKRKWSRIDTVEKLMLFRPVEVTEKKISYIRLWLWKDTQSEPDYGKKLEKQIKLCEEKNTALGKFAKELLDRGLSASIHNDWQNLKDLPDNMGKYMLDNPQVPAWGLIALMVLGIFVGKPCH